MLLFLLLVTNNNCNGLTKTLCFQSLRTVFRFGVGESLRKQNAICGMTHNKQRYPLQQCGSVILIDFQQTLEACGTEENAMSGISAILIVGNNVSVGSSH